MRAPNVMVDKLSQLKEIHDHSEQAQIAAKSLDEISRQAKTLNDMQSQQEGFQALSMKTQQPLKKFHKTVQTLKQ